MAQNFVKTKFPGVFYRESAKKLPNGSPDKTYYVSYADALGVQHWKAVGRHSEGMRPNIAANRRAALQESSAQAPVPQKSITVGEAVEEYRLSAERKGKHVDIPFAQYMLHCKKFVHTTPIDKFTPAKAEALKNRLFTHGLSAQSVFHALNFLRRSINFAVASGKARSNPLSSKVGGVFTMPKVDNERLRYFTPAEADRILETLKRKSFQLYQMSFLSLHTGLRATEIFRLRKEDVDVNAGCLYIVAKGGRREVAPAGPEVIEMLLSIPKHKGPWLFPDENGAMRTRIPCTFNRTIDELGLQAPMGSPYRITFHTWRHTFASLLAQSGKVTLHELMTLMRHRSLSMTMRYAHLIPSETSKKLSYIQEIIKEAGQRD